MEILAHANHVYGWESAVYMSCMSQSFRLFHASNLSVQNFFFWLTRVSAVTDELTQCDMTGDSRGSVTMSILVLSCDDEAAALVM